jgi:two-component system, OmpR family, phosphate regulon response regulator OmpR
MTPSSASIPISDDAPHILIVDDDRRLRDLLARFLKENGYRVTTAGHAADADSRREGLVFDAMVLDVMMPGENGLDFAKRIRLTSSLPILMLTARADPADRIKGLEIGVDDYLPKPFEPRELILRLGNILRRAPVGQEKTEPDLIRFGAFEFWFERGDLIKNGELVRIAEREREILKILGNRANQNVARDELVQGQPHASERTIDVQITRLRRKIEINAAEPRYLQTVRGIGYRLVTD